MIAQSRGHRSDELFCEVPIDVAVHAVGATGAFTHRFAAFVDGQNFRIFLSEPDWRGGSGRGEDHFDVTPLHDIHHTAEPGEVIFALFTFAQAPGEFTHA